MFMLAYDDVTDHSIDMEMARLLLEQRIKQEEQAKEEALKAFGIVVMTLKMQNHHRKKNQTTTDDEISQNPFADDDFFAESSDSENDGKA